MKRRCKWGCGKYMSPGPITQHEKFCSKRPASEPEVSFEQPTGECKWGCGKVTTLGALSNHEAYGCPKRKTDGARRTCPYCGDVTTTPGALARHEDICEKNPVNPQLLGSASEVLR